jgi:hypothetical protein
LIGYALTCKQYSIPIINLGVNTDKGWLFNYHCRTIIAYSGRDNCIVTAGDMDLNRAGIMESWLGSE